MNKVDKTIQIPETLDAELRQRAEARGIELAELVSEALGRYLEDIDDITEDELRWSQFERDGKSVSGEAIKSWIESWGTPDEQPIPKP